MSKKPTSKTSYEPGVIYEVVLEVLDHALEEITRLRKLLEKIEDLAKAGEVG